MPPEKPTHPSIECAKNGPYLVRNVEMFTNSQGDAIPTRRTIVLCRCGASKNKPFCDGSHDRVGFNSNKGDGRVEDQLDIYQGEGITIRDNRGICAQHTPGSTRQTRRFAPDCAAPSRRRITRSRSW